MATTAYRYWRINITRVRENGADGTSGIARVSELSLYTAAGVKWPQVDMTSNVLPSPYVASASSVLNPTNEPFNAFNGTPFSTAGTYHSSSGAIPAWIKIDLGSSVALSYIDIAPANLVSLLAGYFLLDFTLQGSNTGAFAGEQETVLLMAGLTTGWIDDTPRRFFVAESTVDANLPTAIFQAGFGIDLNGTLPMGTLQAGFGMVVDNGLLPMGALSGYFGGFVQGNLPLPEIDFSARDSTGENAVTATLPTGVFEAYFGGSVTGTLPRATFDASATFSTMAVVDGTLPLGVFDIAGTGTPYVVSVDSTLPMGGLLADLGGWVDGSLPVGTLSAQAATGAVATVDGALPVGLFGFDATTQNTMTVDGMLPMMQTVAFITVDGIMPVGVLDAQLSQVIAAAYEAYAVNLNHSGDNPVDEVTRYTNFPFTHIVRYQGSYFGVAANGLYLLEGTTDHAVPTPKAIKWQLETHLTDFGNPLQKTPVSAYVGGRLGRAETFTLLAGEKKESVYKYTNPRGATAQNYRQKLARGVKARYFAVGLQGDGAAEIDNLEFEVNTMTRRI